MEELEKNGTSTQAEENTVSLASAQALADALAKIEVYTPTTWVDNSSPDIDAEHLNKPEQAIKRVTDALNSAVDVIKDLQSQVTKNAGDISTVNNNLSNYDKNNVDSPTIADCNSPGVKEGTLNENSKNTPNTEGLTAATEGHLSTIFPNRAGSWNAQMALYNGKNPCVFLRGSDTEWAKWLALATKSDLTDIIIEKGFQKSVNIPAGNAYATIECDIEYTVPSGYSVLTISKGLVTDSACCVYNTYLIGGKARLVVSNLNGSQKTVAAYAFILFVKS